MHQSADAEDYGHAISTGEAAAIAECSSQTIMNACDKGIYSHFRLPLGTNSERRIFLDPFLSVIQQYGYPVDEPGHEIFPKVWKPTSPVNLQNATDMETLTTGEVGNILSVSASYVQTLADRGVLAVSKIGQGGSRRFIYLKHLRAMLKQHGIPEQILHRHRQPAQVIVAEREGLVPDELIDGLGVKVKPVSRNIHIGMELMRRRCAALIVSASWARGEGVAPGKILKEMRSKNLLAASTRTVLLGDDADADQFDVHLPSLRTLEHCERIRSLLTTKKKVRSSVDPEGPS